MIKIVIDNLNLMINKKIMRIGVKEGSDIKADKPETDAWEHLDEHWLLEISAALFFYFKKNNIKNCWWWEVNYKRQNKKW